MVALEIAISWCFCKSAKLENAIAYHFPHKMLEILSKLFNKPFLWTSLVAQMVKCLSTMQETWVWSLGWEDPLEKEMSIHSTTIAWKIPWTEEPGRLQAMGSQRDTTERLNFTFFMVQLSHPYFTTQKTIALTIWLFAGNVMSLHFFLNVSAKPCLCCLG